MPACPCNLAPRRGARARLQQPRPRRFQIEADSADDEAPAAPEVELSRLKRGQPAERDGCSMEASSCDSTAYVQLNVQTEAEAADEVGYVLEVSGDSPSGLSRHPGRPLSPPNFMPGALRLTWEDGDGERSYDFDIDVWSVDRAGNMSAEPTRVHVESGGGGCAAGARRPGAAWMVLLIVALWWRRGRYRLTSA